MNDTIGAQMLAALTSDIVQTPVDLPPIDEQKRYMQRKVDALTVEDRRDIGQILISAGLRSALIWCSEGTVINLDTLPPHIIEQMYTYTIYKINKK